MIKVNSDKILGLPWLADSSLAQKLFFYYNSLTVYDFFKYYPHSTSTLSFQKKDFIKPAGFDHKNVVLFLVTIVLLYMIQPIINH